MNAPAAALAALSSLAVLLPAQHRKPNVLLLIADDLGVDYVGCYREGRQPANTPNIDQLAAAGVLFRNAWAYPLCSPTRAALMTGRYGLRTGVGHLVMDGGPGGMGAGPFGGQRRFGPGGFGGRQGGGADRRAGNRRGAAIADELTLPKLLDASDSGYRHGLIGKWHLGGGDDGPNASGWSHFAGLIAGVIGRSYFSWRRTVNGKTATTDRYATTQMTDDALAFIRANEEQAQPWLCVVSFVAPHSPFHRPPDGLHTMAADQDQGRAVVANYRAMVEALDTEIGRLLGGLGEARARTNVIFIGDNGTPGQVVQEPFRKDEAKGTMYEGGINVPLIVAGPAVRGDARETPALVHAVDLYASIAELCGTPVAAAERTKRHIDSVSFVPVLRDAARASVRETVYTELFRGDPDRNGQAAIRDARYKMIRTFRGAAAPKDRLYDLQEDPFELRNLLRRRPPAAITARYDELRTAFERLRATGR